jgi:hypothetical protein
LELFAFLLFKGLPELTNMTFNHHVLKMIKNAGITWAQIVRKGIMLALQELLECQKTKCQTVKMMLVGSSFGM